MKTGILSEKKVVWVNIYASNETKPEGEYAGEYTTEDFNSTVKIFYHMHFSYIMILEQSQ